MHHITNISIVLIFLVSGCSTITTARKQKAPIMHVYKTGNFKLAAKMFSERAEARKDTGDELMWRLDEALTLFYANEYKKSLKVFERAEQIVNDFENRAKVTVRGGASEVASAVTNPNAIPYKGYCYDKLLINAYKALVYFALGKREDALVEIRRMHERQKEVVRIFEKEIEKEEDAIKKRQEEILKKQAKGKKKVSGNELSFASLLKNKRISESYAKMKRFSNKVYGNFVNPFTLYISAIGYLMNNNYNDALVDFRNLVKADASNKLLQRDFKVCKGILDSGTVAIKNKKDTSLSNKVVYIIFANGRAPALKQIKIDLILPFAGYTGFAYPEPEYFPAPCKTLRITDSSGNKYHTQIIADMDAIISQEFSEWFPLMLTRIVIATITKEAISTVATITAYRTGGIIAYIGALIITGIYKYAFNTADTRSWETLPKQYQVIHFPLPKDGIITISPANSIIPDTSKPNVVTARPRMQLKLDPSKNFVIIYVTMPTHAVMKAYIFPF